MDLPLRYKRGQLNIDYLMGFFILIVSILLIARMVMYHIPQYTSSLEEQYAHEHAWVASERLLHMMEDERYVLNKTKMNLVFNLMNSTSSGVFMPGVGAIVTEYPVVLVHENGSRRYGRLVFNHTGSSNTDVPVEFVVWDSLPQPGFDTVNITLPGGTTRSNLHEGDWVVIPSTGDTPGQYSNYTILEIDPAGGFVVLEHVLRAERKGIKDSINSVRVTRYTTNNGFVTRLDVYYAGAV